MSIMYTEYALHNDGKVGREVDMVFTGLINLLGKLEQSFQLRPQRRQRKDLAHSP